MRLIQVSIAAAALLAACTPKAADTAVNEPAAAEPVVAAPAAPIPGEVMEEAYADCSWGEVSGAGLSMWSYTCPNLKIMADAALPGFQREYTDEAGKVFRTPVVQIFTKAADAPISAIIDAVRLASPGADACEIEPGIQADFVLMPTGDALTAYEKSLSDPEAVPSLPCGPLGPTEVGGRTFRVVEGAPDKVAMIDWGSEIQPFDPDTLRAADAP